MIICQGKGTKRKAFLFLKLYWRLLARVIIIITSILNTTIFLMCLCHAIAPDLRHLFNGVDRVNPVCHNSNSGDVSLVKYIEIITFIYLLR